MERQPTVLGLSKLYFGKVVYLVQVLCTEIVHNVLPGNILRRVMNVVHKSKVVGNLKSHGHLVFDKFLATRIAIVYTLLMILQKLNLFVAKSIFLLLLPAYGTCNLYVRTQLFVCI